VTRHLNPGASCVQDLPAGFEARDLKFQEWQSLKDRHSTSPVGNYKELVIHSPLSRRSSMQGMNLRFFLAFSHILNVLPCRAPTPGIRSRDGNLHSDKGRKMISCPHN
jgi:hypothetical protein